MVRRFSGVKFKGRGIEIDATTSVGRFRKTLLLPQTQKGLVTANGIRSSILLDDQFGKLDLAKYFPNDNRLIAKSPNKELYLTVKSCLDRWMRDRERRDQLTTTKQDWIRIEKYLFPDFGDLKIGELCAHHLRDFRTRHPNLKNKTINNILSILTGLYKSLYRDDVIKTNPIDRYQHLPTRHKDRNPYTKAEVEKLLGEFTNPQIRNYFTFAFETGLRPPTEILGLKWDDVDWQGKRIYVCRALRNGLPVDLKTKESIRHVNLTETAISSLEKQKTASNPGDYIFVDPTTGEPYKNDQSIRKRYWIPAVNRAGIRQEPPYVTRHTFASSNLSNGKNFMYIADQMGHTDLKMLLEHYGKYIPQETLNTPNKT